MARHPRPKTVELLTQARKYIADESVEYVCWAITKAHWDKHFQPRGVYAPPEDSIAGKLLRRINRALGKYPTVVLWLKHEHGATHQQLFAEGGAREYRLRWIDQLIKEYS